MEYKLEPQQPTQAEQIAEDEIFEMSLQEIIDYLGEDKIPTEIDEAIRQIYFEHRVEDLNDPGFGCCE